MEGELPDRKGEILIGVNLAKEANLKVEDQVTFLTDFNRGETATITGFFDLEQSNLNSTWILTDTETAQDLFGYGEDVTSIEMQVEDVFQADTIGDAIETDLPEGFTVENWKEQNAALLSGLDGQSISSYMIQAFVMISVLLGIASVLAISVIQKSRQIGILKAMGIRNGTASLIFLFQGLLLGIAGAVLGNSFGAGTGFCFHLLCPESGWFSGGSPLYKPAIYCVLRRLCPFGGSNRIPGSREKIFKVKSNRGDKKWLMR